MNTASPTPRPQLVYLVFGAETYHQEAVFSIASALAHLGGPQDMPLDIQVFSDNPAPYRGLPVQANPTATTFAPNMCCCARYWKPRNGRC